MNRVPTVDEIKAVINKSYGGDYDLFIERSLRIKNDTKRNADSIMGLHQVYGIALTAEWLTVLKELNAKESNLHDIVKIAQTEKATQEKLKLWSHK